MTLTTLATNQRPRMRTIARARDEKKIPNRKRRAFSCVFLEVGVVCARMSPVRGHCSVRWLMAFEKKPTMWFVSSGDIFDLWLLSWNDLREETRSKEPGVSTLNSNALHLRLVQYFSPVYGHSVAINVAIPCRQHFLRSVLWEKITPDSQQTSCVGSMTIGGHLHLFNRRRRLNFHLIGSCNYFS